MSHSTPAPSLLAGAAAAGAVPVRSATTTATPARPRRGRSVLRAILTLGALAAIAASYWQPFWTFKLYAPQYPSGLALTISLTGFSGDVREIDMLNHYIGMASLEHGAALERRYSHLLVGLLVGAIAALAALRSARAAALAAALGAAYPLGFLADTFYWLYRFGHELDPRAPLRIPHFTPQLFGNGTIGQFMTFALPQPGFVASLVAAVLLLVAALLRTRKDAECRQS